MKRTYKTRRQLAAEAAQSKAAERDSAEKMLDDLAATLRRKRAHLKVLHAVIARPIGKINKLERIALAQIAEGFEDEIAYYSRRVDEARDRVRKLGGVPITLESADDVMTLLESLGVSEYSMHNATPTHVMLYVADQHVEKVFQTIRKCKVPAVSIDVQPRSVDA